MEIIFKLKIYSSILIVFEKVFFENNMFIFLVIITTINSFSYFC